MSNPEQVTVLQKNFDRICQRIRSACERRNHSEHDVKLLAVTKYAEWPWVKSLAALHGCLGESRPQQLMERAPQLPDTEWHMIGSLQSNKVRQVVRAADVIHSVDSLKLLERVSRIAAEEDADVRVLLQVNVSGETSKSGFDPHDLLESWNQIPELLSAVVHVVGLMTMAPAADDPEATRPVFAGLAQLRKELIEQSPEISLPHLSMGMSRDFEVAIEEGATLIRVGSALFEGLN